MAAIEGVVMRLKNGFELVLAFECIQLSNALEAEGTDLEPVSSLVQAGARIARFSTPCPSLDAHENLCEPLFMPVCDTQRLMSSYSIPAPLLAMNNS